ncbi:MAG: homoserine dehydrogenase [Rickettsiales bacterium]|nr:homoserine dehydrogenase [Rickettsiales bacterium]
MSSSLKIAIAGLGTVGSGVMKILADKQEILHKKTGKKIEIIAVSARDKNKARDINLSHIKWCDNALELAEIPEAEAIIELIGGAEGISKELAFKAIKNKKHYVTANKALLSKYGVELAKLAEENNLYLQFEASVAGGIPVIKTIKEALLGNKISKISAILNGTCNFILSSMFLENKSFEDALLEAQKLGYAEADPSFDIDGIDASHKLSILSALAYSIKPDVNSIYVEGIRNISLKDIKYALQFGFRIRLIATSLTRENGFIEQRVHPSLVALSHEMAYVDGVLGAVKLECDALGPLYLEGAGAGMMQTASAVVADICDIARGNFSYPFSSPASNLSDAKYSSIEDHEGEFYLRFSVKDEDGVLSSITSIFSNNSVGFEKIHQQSAGNQQSADVVFMTRNEKEKAILSSLKEIQKQNYLLEKPVMIRVER